MSVVKFEEIELNIVEDSRHEFLLSTKEVALGYGVVERVIRDHKSNNQDELIENKHFIIDYSYKNTPKTLWTKRGIVRLGFFIKSERAKKFRDWAEDLILKKLELPIHIKQLQHECRKLQKENMRLKRELQEIKNENYDLTLQLTSQEAIKYVVDVGLWAEHLARVKLEQVQKELSDEIVRVTKDYVETIKRVTTKRPRKIRI